MKNTVALCFMYCLTLLFAGYTHAEKIVINEISYRTEVLSEKIEFLELYNADVGSVDLSGWYIEGIEFVIPSGTILNAGEYLIIAQNMTDVQNRFAIPGTAIVVGSFAGKLSNNGEDISLRDANFVCIDKVNYKGWDEWPNTGYLDTDSTKVVASLQKIHPLLDGNTAGAWRAEVPTPGALNSVVYVSNYTTTPIIDKVSHFPKSPLPGENVTIDVDIDNIGLAVGLSVSLEYQLVQPGNYITKSDPNYNSGWSVASMTDTGDGKYTADIPGNVQTHRMLVRYRIHITDNSGMNILIPDQNHRESNFAYYVYGTYPLVGSYDINALNSMQEITVLTTDSMANTYIGPGTGIDNTGQYTGYDYLGEGTLIYNGKVYDHVRFRPRGRTGGRAARHKPGIKFNMNSAHTFAPLDDCGNEYEEKRGKLTLSGTYVNDVAAHGLTESLIHKTIELTGGMERGADYTQLRIVNDNAEAQDFWGVFLILEGYDGDYLKEHNHVDGNIWRYKDYRLSYRGDFPGSDTIAQWPRDMTIVDWDLLFGDKVANQFLGNGANNYEGKHSQRNYYNPETGNWHVWYGDYDTTFGMSYDDGTYHVRSSSSDSQIVKIVQDISSMETEYENTMRSVYDLLFNQEQSDFLVDMESAKIYDPAAAYDWTTVDNYRWNQVYDLDSVDAHIDWYKTWFQNRSAFLSNDTIYGFYNIIPDKPVISLTGTAALDDLTFDNSAFAHPMGAGFAALEWRVGEWSDPANPVYQNICEPRYEIQTVWKSGEITSFSNSFTVPGTAELQAGRTYKIRVRYKDDVGRWSHWSDAETLIAGEALNAPTPAIVINEIMYNPDKDCGTEFIELKNNENATVSLEGYTFTDGVEYTFPAGTTISAGGFIVIASDSVAFYHKYGFYPTGDYSGSLSNDGERLELTGLYNTIIDSLTYNDANIWDGAPDGSGPSLELLDVSMDNAAPLTWFRSDNTCGTPNAENSRICTAVAESITINEINYNSPNSPDAGDWIELHNTGAATIDISGWDFYDDGNQFTIANGTSIEPGGFLLLVQNDTLFTSVFPHITDYLGNFEFNLSGGGERISLFDENKCLSDYVVYDDDQPWDTIPDGNGSTLSLINPTLDNSLPPSWEASVNINSVNGTPGRANEPCIVQEIFTADTICAGIPTLLTLDVLGDDFTYNWFVSGTPALGVTNDSVTVEWTNAGVYTVQLITKYFECTKIYTKQITVTECNLSPLATNDTFTTTEDTPLNNTVSLNDSDPDGHNLIWATTPVTAPANGSLIINTDGTFTYTPNLNFEGNDSFQYEVCDDATFSFTTPSTFVRQVASGADDVEERLNGSINTTSGDLDMVDDSGVLYNAVGIRMTNISIPQNATITNAYLEFEADESNSQVTSLTISAENIGNAPPISTNPFVLSNKIKTATANWSNIPIWTAGNTYASSDISTVVQQVVNRTDWQSGNAMTFIIQGSGIRTAKTYDNASVVAPKLIVDYQVVDDGVDISRCDVATVTLNVLSVNDEPTANDDNRTTQEDVPVSGNLVNNDMDTDGDSFAPTLTPITQPVNGSVFILSSGLYAYTPNPDFNGIDSFEYEICDTGSPVMCDNAIVSIDVNPVNDAPVAVADTYNMIGGDTLVGNVLQNDTDIDGDVLSVNTTVVASPANGVLSIAANGDISYTPNPGYLGNDQFTYEVCDPAGLCSATDVIIVIDPGCVDVQLYVWIEGAYDENTYDMRTDLNNLRGLLPGQTPVSTIATATPAGQPYNMPPWDYSGTEGAGWTDADYTTDAVDWLLVGFRTGKQKATEIARTAALLNKDGSLYFPDRCALLSEQDSVYVVIEHRNHMGVMSPTAVNITNDVLIHDFRAGDSYKDATSFGQKQFDSGEWGMYAGDGDQSDVPSYDLNGNDKTIWLMDNGVFNIYMNIDYNLDGDVNGADKVLWSENNGFSSRVPK